MLSNTFDSTQWILEALWIMDAGGRESVPSDDVAIDVNFKFIIYY